MDILEFNKNKIWSFEEAEISQIPRINQLVNSAYRGDYSKKGWTTEAHILDGLRMDEVRLETLLKDPEASLYVVRAKEQQTFNDFELNPGDIIGCVELRRKAEGCYLGMLTVEPQLQSSGLGRWLLEKSQQQAIIWGFKKIFMTVITARAELIDWYQRRGYKRTGQLVPFPTDPAFGIPKQPIVMEILEMNL